MMDLDPAAVIKSLQRRIGELSGEAALLEAALERTEARAVKAEERLAELMQVAEKS